MPGCKPNFRWKWTWELYLVGDAFNVLYGMFEVIQLHQRGHITNDIPRVVNGQVLLEIVPITSDCSTAVVKETRNPWSKHRPRSSGWLDHTFDAMICQRWTSTSRAPMWTFQDAQPKAERVGMDRAPGGSQGPGPITQPEDCGLWRWGPPSGSCLWHSQAFGFQANYLSHQASVSSPI